MATIGNQVLTFADWAKRVDDDYRVAAIVELLSQTNEIMDDMLVMEANQPTGHKTTVRTGLPAATWRLLNFGIPVGKSHTAQIIDTIGNLESESQIDIDLAELNGNTPEFRLSEARAFLEGMNQQMAQTIFYGNTLVTPERFTGLAPRYNTITPANAQTAANVVNAGGTSTDNTSIWILTWGADTTHGIFPKGKIGGLQHEDKGKWRVFDSNNNPYYAYVDHFKWELGLCVRDWRFNARIANIDVSDLQTASAANLINAMVRAMYRIPVMPAQATAIQTSDSDRVQESMGRVVIYANRVIRTYFDLQAMNKTNVLLRLEEFMGKVVTTFRGIPIRTCDQILNTEAALV